MGVRLITGATDDPANATYEYGRTALYDSVSGWAFGPTFDSQDDALAFLEWLDSNDHGDPRSVSDKELARLYGEWVDQYEGGADAA